jgi:hypothetical protein
LREEFHERRTARRSFAEKDLEEEDHRERFMREVSWEEI